MTDFDAVKDSGERQTWDTGSRRDTREGKGRYDLIPPVFLRRLARHLENGAVKYGDRNWELGQPLSRYLDSAIRHTYNVLDLQTDEDHPSAGVWNLMAFLCTAEWIIEGKLPRELDDIGYCDALEEAQEDAGLKFDISADVQPFVEAMNAEIRELAKVTEVPYFSIELTDEQMDELGIGSGRPARAWTEDDVVEADMVVDYAGEPEGQTTVLSGEGAPTSYADEWVQDFDAQNLRPLGPEWVDMGYLTEPLDIAYTDEPLAHFKVDTEGVISATDFASQVFPRVDLSNILCEDDEFKITWHESPMQPMIDRVNQMTRELAERAFPLRVVPGVPAVNDRISEALKGLATYPGPKVVLPGGAFGRLFDVPVYRVDDDDPVLDGQEWAIVPEDEARAAVQRGLDRDSQERPQYVDTDGNDHNCGPAC